MNAITWPRRALIGAIAFAIVSAAPASAVPRPPVKITIGGMSYSAPQMNARVGDTVEWINKDVVDHTATEKQKSIWNVSIAPGKSMKVVMKKAGTYDYYCRYHPNMVGRLIIK